MQTKIAIKQKAQRMLNTSPEPAHLESIKELINQLFRAERNPEFSNTSPLNSDSLDKEFSTIFSRAKKTLELDDETISELIGISRPTIHRWENGESAPYFLAQPHIFKCIRKEAMRKLITHRFNHLP